MAKQFTQQQQDVIQQAICNTIKTLQLSTDTRSLKDDELSSFVTNQIRMELDKKIPDVYSDRVKGYGKSLPLDYPEMKMFTSEWVRPLEENKWQEDGDLKESPEDCPKQYDGLIIKGNDDFVNFNTVIEPQHTEYTFHENTELNSSFCLKEYQKEGIAKLQTLMLDKVSGCLLADDMGLGKTLQLLYLVDWYHRSNPKHGPCLLVAPVSLLSNWKSEYEKFFNEPRMKMMLLRSGQVTYSYNQKIIDAMQNMDIILVSYETMRKAQLNLCAVQFDIVVLDEVQKIKNPQTQTTKAAKALNAKFKVAVTGTPVENSLSDLWSIIDFCLPGLLGSYQSFFCMYNISNCNLLNGIIQPYMIRRLKKEVIKELPTLTEHILKEELAAVQYGLYKDVVNHYIPGVNILSTIMGLKTISEHPFLYDGDNILNYPTEDIILSSARLIKTMEVLYEIRRIGDKVIVYIERKDMQKAMKRVIYEKFGISSSIINGDTPTCGKQGNVRQMIIDEFQKSEGFNIIILSPLSAGVGLNITAANHVIHYSRHWNPAKEQQASDRVYRIGQTKDVHIYYPMAMVYDKEIIGFDETLSDLLEGKKQLAENTIIPTKKLDITIKEMAQQLFPTQH